MDKIGDMDPPDEAGFTIDDLHAIPEGRLRYELIEGSLQVSPSATAAHNIIALDKAHRSYRYVTHYTTGVFRTETPWPVEIDLPALTARRAQIRGWARGKS